MAAERMQREEAATYAARVDKINQQYQEKMNQANTLAQQVAELKVRFFNFKLKFLAQIT